MGRIWKILCLSVVTCSLFMSVITMADENPGSTEKSGISPIAYTSNIMGNDAPQAESESKSSDYYSMMENATEASTVNNPITLKEIEQLSNAIIRATFLDVIKQEEFLDSFGTPIYAFTHSSICVDEVYAGNVKAGDVLSIFEPYYITENNGTYILTHHGNYYPSEAGKSYIWFLNQRSGAVYDTAFGLDPDQNYYALSWCERSRYPVIESASANADNMSNQDLDLSPSGSSFVYKKIYNEVIQKYFTNETGGT